MLGGPPQSLSSHHQQLHQITTQVRSTLTNPSPIKDKTASLNPLPIQDRNLDSHISASPGPTPIIPHPTNPHTRSSSPSPTPRPTDKMPSSSSTKNGKTYAPSVASTSSSASYAKPSKSPQPGSKRRTAILNGAKKLLSDMGSPPTAAYDRQQAAKGEPKGEQKVLYMPNHPPPRT